MSEQMEAASSRSEARREQILDAAAACFAREGFHGASIARLSREAGMSPGHIYHFFANKEAIIAELVQRKLRDSLDMARHFENSEDVFEAMIDRVDQGLNERTDPATAALDLEIWAEAARNPRVAAMVRAADHARREQFQRVLGSVRTGRDRTADPQVCELIMALFEGLAARAVCHPELDRDALLPWLRAALGGLIRPDQR